MGSLSKARSVIKIVSCLILMLSASCDTAEYSYTDLGAALSSRPGQGGWVPGCLPQSARSIRLKYSFDTNEVWASFLFDRSDIEQFEKNATRMNLDSISDISVRSARAVWWHSALRGKLNPDEIKRSGLNIYRINCISIYPVSGISRSAYFAVQENSHAAYYWHKGF
jgi:hypothetical protein